MIRLPSITLDEDAIDALNRLQARIDALPTFDERRQRAKAIFSQYNRKGNPLFDKVRDALTTMCSGAERCAYCEDSKSDEVEHIFPKDLYPEKCFDWNNYLYACGPCNGPKNNKFAIFKRSDGVFQEINTSNRTPAVETPDGDPVLINPRTEDPLEFCMLDLALTFKFVIIATPGSREYHRADYTYNTILRLNDQREYLRKARKSAFQMYKARLFEYVAKRNQGATEEQLQKIIDGIKKEAHPTVWKEMQRQYQKGILQKVNVELENLFASAPEALDW